MSIRYRVFCSGDVPPVPTDLQAWLGTRDQSLSIHFDADATGWYRGEITGAQGTLIEIERWLADEEGIRAELNSWAGHLETLKPDTQTQRLMEHTIQTRQLLTMCPSPTAGDQVQALCLELARLLASTTAGFYQVDQQGFFAADGTLLVKDV